MDTHTVAQPPVMNGRGVTLHDGSRPPATRRRVIRLTAVQLAVVGAGVLLVRLALDLGESTATNLGAVDGRTASAGAAGHGDLLANVLLAALVVVAVAGVKGALALRIGQPRVVGEIVGGLLLLGPTVLGARSLGVPWRDSTALGVLMNTRGLTELVILGVCLQRGAIPHDRYGLLVVMTLVTTAATTPLLALILPSTRNSQRPLVVSDAARAPLSL